MTVTFLNPVTGGLVVLQPYTLRANLEGLVVVGLVINKIVQCDVFMGEIGKALSARRPGLVIRPYETQTITFANAKLMERVAQECDVAVCAIGHCGSCTAGTVKDGIALIERGYPAISLVTKVFWEQAAALARSLGWPDAPRVKLPYPIEGSDPSYMAQVADSTAEQILSTFEHADVQTA